MAEWVKKTSLPLIDRLKGIQAGFDAVVAEYLKREAEKVEHLAKVLTEHQQNTGTMKKPGDEP